jgi:hypothetical protein
MEFYRGQLRRTLAGVVPQRCAVWDDFKKPIEEFGDPAWFLPCLAHDWTDAIQLYVDGLPIP